MALIITPEMLELIEMAKKGKVTKDLDGEECMDITGILYIDPDHCKFLGNGLWKVSGYTSLPFFVEIQIDQVTVRDSSEMENYITECKLYFEKLEKNLI